MHPLIKLAKDTIRNKYNKKTISIPKEFNKEEGCFVTINKQGKLRGCIGFITSKQPLYKSIQEAAVAAAQNDPRFPPVQEEELPDLKIEVSVLSKPQKVMSTDPTKRQAAFNPGITGLIIQRGWKSGVLLPQVFDKTTTAEEALRMTCEKAGLPRQAWKEPATNIYTFTATIYTED